MYSTIERGQLHSPEYRVFFKDNQTGNVVSPFHDIPLEAAGSSSKEAPLYNMVVEIPRWSNAKMEIATKEPYNPIKQDSKKGKLRYVSNVFPHHGYIWNYGALPQTWENPAFIDPHTKCHGDNDPIDVCEIGSKVLPRGSVVPVKVLGIMALIDDGETDWKLIVIHAQDPLAEKLNDIDQVETIMPGLLKATYEWFKLYKIPDGKLANKFAFDGEAKNAKFALNIIKETHDQWKELIYHDKPEGHGIDLLNTGIAKAPSKADPAEALNHVNSLAPHIEGSALKQQEIDEISKIHFVKE